MRLSVFRKSLKWPCLSLILHDQLSTDLKYTTSAHLTQLLIFHMLDVSDYLKREFPPNYHTSLWKTREDIFIYFCFIECFSPYNGHLWSLVSY